MSPKYTEAFTFVIVYLVSVVRIWFLGRKGALATELGFLLREP